MDRLAALKAFARVAETRSFSAAARDLRLSKSLISRQVAALENDLGVRLFQRTTRSLTLTEAGLGYFENIARILSDLDAAQAAVTQMQATPRGKLRINAPMSFSILHLSPAIPDFLAQYPDIELDIVMNDRYVDLVDEGFDLGVRIGRLTDSSMVARKITPMKRVVCASPAYLEKYGTPQTPDDLRKHQCLCYSNLSLADEWRFTTPEGKPWPVMVRGRLHANNGDALRAAALKGIGIGFLPSFIIGGDVQAAKLTSILEDYVPQDSAIYAVYPHARLLSPKVRSFVNFMIERFGQRPHWDLGL